MLGEGGMGVVLLANERVLDRLVAIKVLRRDAAQDPELRERFRREARVAAGLAHPHIIPLITFGDVEGELFYVMGYVEGESLAERLRRETRLPHAEAVRILTEICDALALAHERGIVHRDIKPENVLLEARSGRVLIADFGIAREQSARTAITGTGVSLGTPHYMAPEQVASDSTVDHRADLYATGVLAYRVLSGRLPFDGNNLREVLTQHIVAKPRDLRLEVPDLEPRIAAAVMRCLEKLPDDRWPSAAALRSALQPAMVLEEELPDVLAGQEGMGTTLLAVSGGTVVLGIANTGYWHNEILRDLLPLAIWAPLVAIPVAWIANAREFGWRRVVNAFFRPPRSWALWWPRIARRPSDVWDRLPAAVRASRTMIFGAVALLAFGAFPMLVLFMTLTPEQLGTVLNASSVEATLLRWSLNLATILGTAGGVIGFLWKRRHAPKSSGPDDLRWLSEPVASPRWRRPDLSRFLLPESGEAQIPPETAERLVEGIAEQVRALGRQGAIPDQSAESVAREVGRAIGDIDRELAVLAKGGSASELRDLDRKIAALGRDPAAARLLESLQRQHAALREIVDRQESQRLRKERLVRQLRELFAMLAAVQASAHRAADSGVSARIQLACEDLKRLASGYDELRDASTTPIRSAESR